MFMGVFLIIVGLILLVKPEWGAAVEKHRRSSANIRPEDIELSPEWYDFQRIGAIALIIVGSVFIWAA